MNTHALTLLLDQVSQISKHYNHIAKLSGENFNVFKTLKLESSEVRMHSSLLSEFLNPKGSHGQGDKYLKLFLRIEKIAEFEKIKKIAFKSKQAYSSVEKHIGKINSDSSEGGRIDILLTDENSNHIVIENKIYAGDQPKQLLRYHNFDITAPILYLTLLGDPPTKNSLGEKVKEPDYLCLSYKTDIIEWFEECKKESASLPIIRETISQYINLLKHLTNQTIRDDMKEEIKKLMIKNPEYIESIDLCSQTLNEVIKDTHKEFLALLKKHNQTISIDDKYTELKLICEEDGGVFFGYQLIEKGKNISLSDKPINKKIKNNLENKLRQLGYKLNSNEHFISWFSPHLFKERHITNFKDLDKKYIVDMYAHPAKLAEFVAKIIEEEEKVRAGLRLTAHA